MTLRLSSIALRQGCCTGSARATRRERRSEEDEGANRKEKRKEAVGK